MSSERGGWQKLVRSLKSNQVTGATIPFALFMVAGWLGLGYIMQGVCVRALPPSASAAAKTWCLHSRRKV